MKRTKHGKYIRTFTVSEKEKYFTAYMAAQGYNSTVWLDSGITFEVYAEDAYTVVIAFKTVRGVKLPIYKGYHKCMEKFKAA